MIGRIVTGRGNARQSHELPARKDERRDIGLLIKKALFPGASFRHAKARGATALAVA